MGALVILFILLLIIIICTSTVPSQPITTFRGAEILQAAGVLYVTILQWQRQSSWSQLMLERMLSQLLSLTCGLWFTSARINQHKQLRDRAVLSTLVDLGSGLNSHGCCSHSLKVWTSGSSQSIRGYVLAYSRLKTEGSTTLDSKQREPGLVFYAQSTITVISGR